MSGFQKIWEDLRAEGKHLTKYPYDGVVSFVFRHIPKGVSKNEVNVLDVGCGIGNHLWFLAREGFNAYGIDGSKSAVEIAKGILKENGLTADVRVGDFTEPLPYPNDFFHLVFDRCSISSISYSSAKGLIEEIWRVMKPSSYFLFTPYSKVHSSYILSRSELNDGFVEVKDGSLAGTGYVQFYGDVDILNLFSEDKWDIISMVESISIDRITFNINGGWSVIVKKKVS